MPNLTFANRKRRLFEVVWTWGLFGVKRNRNDVNKCGCSMDLCYFCCEKVERIQVLSVCSIGAWYYKLK